MDKEEVSKVLYQEFIGPPKPTRIAVIGLGANIHTSFRALEVIMQEDDMQDVLRKKFPNYVFVFVQEETPSQVVKLGLVDDGRKIITESLKKILNGTVVVSGPSSYVEDNLNRQISPYLPKMQTRSYLRQQARKPFAKKQGRK